MVKPRPLPALEVLQEHFDYEPETGLLRGKSGKVLGSKRKDGYIKVDLKGRQLFAHRVAWKLMTFEEPPEVIDHIDRDRSNNRWENLRSSDWIRNQGNRICKEVYKKRWGFEARGAEEYLGVFKTEKEAHQTYVQWHLSYFGSDSVYSAHAKSGLD